MARVSTTFYAQFKAERTYWDKRVMGMHAVKLTQNKPTAIAGDTVVIKFKASLDVEAFENLPVVTVDIPLDVVQTTVAEAVPA